MLTLKYIIYFGASTSRETTDKLKGDSYSKLLQNNATRLQVSDNMSSTEYRSKYNRFLNLGGCYYAT